MKTKQAILEMLNGRKITRDHWMPNMYLEYVDGYFRSSIDGTEYSFKDRPDYGWEISSGDLSKMQTGVDHSRD